MTWCPFSGKAPFATRAAALKALAAHRKPRPSPAGILGKTEAYRCHACGQFHLGHRQPAVKPRPHP